MKTTTKYVFQRLVHRYGPHVDLWMDNDPASFNIDRDIHDHFKKNSTDEEAAIKVIVELSKVRPHESFRAVLRTIVTTDEVGMQIGPRKPFTVADLKKLALNPQHHDGVRDFNGIEAALIEANLNPDNFGAIPSKLVLHAIETINDPVDEWILVHPEGYGSKTYGDWNVRRQWWNLKQRATIESDSHGVGDASYCFRRFDYGKGKCRRSNGNFKTFKAAVSNNKRFQGFTTKEKLINSFPKVKEL